MAKTAGLFGAVPQVPDTSLSWPDRSLNWIALSNTTEGECAPTQAVKQPVTSESFDHRETFKMLLLSTNYG